MCEKKLMKWMDWIPCHRREDRSFHIFRKRLPLCARCLSIVMGYVATPFLLVLNLRIPWYGLLLLIIPMLVDGYTQKWGWRESNNWLRFITGFGFGVSQSGIVVWGVLFIVAWTT
jgi:uncharacterized membrane protein